MAKKFQFEGLVKSAERQQQQTDEFIKQNILIEEELKYLIPEISAEEKAQLEENILKEGCREALVIWEKTEGEIKTYILVDGHNRLDICTRNKIEFKIRLVQFADEYEVQKWMLNNQLGRRNLTPEQQSYLRGKRYELEKFAHGGNRMNVVDDQASRQIVDLTVETENIAENQTPADSKRTAEKLAKEFNVSGRTVERDAQFAKALDFIEQSNPELKRSILSGKVKVKKSDIQTLGQILQKSEPNNEVKFETAEDIEKYIQTPKIEPVVLFEKDDALSLLKNAILKDLNTAIKKPSPTAFEILKSRVEELKSYCLKAEL